MIMSRGDEMIKYLVMVICILSLHTANSSEKISNIPTNDVLTTCDSNFQNGNRSHSENEEKDLVIVSRSPDFFSYSLTGMTILLSAITILVGIITGVLYFSDSSKPYFMQERHSSESEGSSIGIFA